MSGIFGIFNRLGAPASQNTLNTMRDTMIHRAADRDGLACFDNVGIGHLMMETSFNSRNEQLPFHDPSSNLTITCDCRLDNRSALLQTLKINPKSHPLVTDSLLLLKSYEKWGNDCASHLLGDFSFAIWDQNKRRFFCARDHMGVRPLHYAIINNSFVFSSEVRAISSVFPVTLNRFRITDYLLDYEDYDFESTFFNEIKRLAPGHWLSVDATRLRLNCYWKPTADPATHRLSEAENIECFNDILSTAVNSRLDTNIPAGCLLSGGIDSAAILSTAKQLGRNNLVAISAISSNEPCGDTKSIRHINELFQFPQLHLASEELNTLENELSAAFNLLDEPFAAALTLPMALYLSAKKNGQRVILDGVEGDLTLSQPGNYCRGLIKQGQWHRARSEHSAGIALGTTEPTSFMRQLLSAYLPGGITQLRRTSSIKHGVQEQLRKNLLAEPLHTDPEFLNRYRQYHHARQWDHSNLNRQHQAFLRTPMIAVALERYDRAAAVCGVEARHPLLDIRLVEFCLNLPWDQKINQGWSKWILRQAMIGKLPDSVIWRKDHPHLGWNFTETWMQTHWQLIRETIQTTEHQWRPYASTASVSPLIQPSEFSSANDNAGAWSIYPLSLWLSHQ